MIRRFCLTLKILFVYNRRSRAGLFKATGKICVELKPGLHERHKHKDEIKTKTKNDISSGTCEDKTRIFLCFVFCSALGLCLDYNLMLMITTILMSQA